VTFVDAAEQSTILSKGADWLAQSELKGNLVANLTTEVYPLEAKSLEGVQSRC
jgi:hypothetical protein